MKLDAILSELNADLVDCLTPVRDRFRFALLTIFNYAVANPAQGSAATASAAIQATFTATYADALVSPGIPIATFLTVFNNRHGVGATADARWVSVRNWIVARSNVREPLLRALEEGSEPSRAELYLARMTLTPGNPEVVADAVLTLTRDAERFITEERWSSATLGITVRRLTTWALVGGRKTPTTGSWEVV